MLEVNRLFFRTLQNTYWILLEIKYKTYAGYGLVLKGFLILESKFCREGKDTNFFS